MEIVCFDMEGTLTPEIWEQIAINTGINEFNKTTRDIPDYSDLMDFRLEVMKKNNLKLSDIQKASGELDLLEGAEEFLTNIRKNFQVVILSDTFHEIAKPLMDKMGHPLLLCHNLEVRNDEIISYKLRHKQAKKQPAGPIDIDNDGAIGVVSYVITNSYPSNSFSESTLYLLTAKKLLDSSDYDD